MNGNEYQKEAKKESDMWRYTNHCKGHRISAVISFLSQITGRSNQRQVNICLFFEGKKVELTDGFFSLDI